MSFSISAIVLYGHEGQQRVLRFNDHGLSIITGNSKTGKSAIIDIVDYCLGRESYNVAEGEIRRKVLWFGLHLTRERDDVFIARKNPGPSASSGPDVYYQRGRLENYPSIHELSKNTSATSVRRFVTQFAGIVENENRPTSGTREPLSANLKHAIWFCFQPQGTIATKDHLFYRMTDHFLQQALRDTLPYFLDAVGEEHFRYLAEFDELSDKLKLLQAQETKHQQVIEINRKRIVRIIREGQRLGMVRQDFEVVDESVFDYLATIANSRVDEPTIVQDFGESIQNLRSEQLTIQTRLSELNQEILAARTFLSSQTEFAREASEQSARLKSIGLYKSNDESHNSCPLCGIVLETSTPQVQEISESLRRVNDDLKNVYQENPHIQSHINELSHKIEKLTTELKSVQRELANAISENESAKTAQDQLIARAKYLGRLSDFLDTIKEGDDANEAKEQLAELKNLIDIVKQKLNSEDVVSRVETFVNLIGQKMTEFSNQLELEHSGSSLRLDVKKLTVVADTEDGPIPLNRMGSGENWVGYHVLAHLALHWWFRRRNRPIPGFLVLDQPTQAYYPPDRIEGGLDQIEKDADKRAVHALFKLMHLASMQIKGPFQLIVLDHAHLSDDWFESAIVEEWRGDKALVPRGWPSLSTNSNQ